MDLKRVISRAIAIQQIPGPTFEETERAAYLQHQFSEIGLIDVSSDEIGNVYGRTSGSDHPAIVVSAHLDSVFPMNTNLDLQDLGSKLIGPGIGDNAIALALMLEIAEDITRENALAGRIWFVGNVREEGLGNLEGMHRVVERFTDTVRAYIVLEGVGLGHIYHRALQVQRYRISVETPGGHAWIHAGQASAVHKLLQIGSEIIALARPNDTTSSLNIGTIQGGTSINTIASHASFDLDLRSEKPTALDDIEKHMEGIFDRHRSKDIVIKHEVIGHRPGGEIPEDHELVRLACDALGAADVTDCKLGIASTDANVPLSKGIPAICVGLTNGGLAHTPREYIETETILNGYKMLDYLLRGALALSGAEPS